MDLRWHFRAYRNLGLLHAVRHRSETRPHRVEPRGLLFSKHLRYPVSFRRGSSDLEVFSQIFIEREYSCFDDIKDARLIIDLGANVGYSAAYFLSRYRRATVIAVEPDPDNYDLLKRNLEPYGARAIAVHGAVWPEDTTVHLDEASLGQSKEWGRRVVAGGAPGEGIRALSMTSLLQMAPTAEISILKVDIEGAERDLFSKNYEWWLEKVQNLCIELHGTECEDAFSATVSGQNFAFSRSGELTVCRRANRIG